MSKSFRTTFSGLIACAVFCAQAHADRYEITKVTVQRLGTLGGAESVAKDINEHGDIVGWSDISRPERHAFLYRGGVMEDLTTAEGTMSEANGINNHLQIVGQISGPNRPDSHAFFLDYGSPLRLLYDGLFPPVPECRTGGVAQKIADAGYIAGDRLVGCLPYTPPYPPYNHRAVFWVSAWDNYVIVSEVSRIGAPSEAYDVNEHTAVVGWDAIDGAYRWTLGVREWIQPPEVPETQFVWGDARFGRGINDSGRVVGEVLIDLTRSVEGGLTWRPFFWSGNPSRRSVVLPVFPDTGVEANSGAYEINNQDFAVGYAARRRARDGWDRKFAVLWHPDIGIAQLPFAEGVSDLARSHDFCAALSVNDRDSDTGLIQVVGYCSIGGRREAVLWDVTARLVR